MRDRIQNYVFTPGVGGSGTIELQGYVELPDLLVITNVTQNIIIYQFSDPNKGAAITYNPNTSVNFPTSQNGVTTITLDFNTSGMSSLDKLQVYVETREVITRPWHFGTDSIERMRVAQPESLIDADFEYGLQNTKWQSLSLNNLMPGIYEQPGSDLNLNTTGYVTAIASTNTIASNSDTSLDVANQGGTIAPNWVQNDYALLVNTTAVPISVARLTANVTGPQQRTFTFTGNASAFAAGDIVAIYKVEPESSTCNVATTISSTGTTSLVIQGANTIVNGNFLQVATNTAGVYELMAVTSGGGSGTLTVVRQRANTNPTGININANNEVRVLANIEIGNVETVTSNVSMAVNRGWYNTTALDFLTAGTTIQKLYQDTGNLEIVKLTTIGTTVANTVTVTRGAVGTTPISTAIASGGLLISMKGVYVAGTSGVPQIGINSTSHGIATGDYLSTQNHAQPDSEGLYFSYLSETNNLFYFPKKSSGLALGSPLNRYDTNLRKASAFTGAPIPYSTIVSDGSNPSTITVTTPYAHGLQPGTPLLIQLTSGSTNFADYGSGPFAILSTPTLTTFTVQAKTGAAVTGTLGGTIIIKPNSSFLHRPFDGGIAMTCGSPHHGALAARQTKKYFRYQSGKGMFFTSGTLFAPTFDISTATASNVNIYGSITISTEQNHQLQIGAVVRLSGFNTGGYNGTYRVTSITSDRAFTVQIYQTLASTTPAFAPQPRVNVVGWYGGVVRAGLYDDQNGVFWEYDGEQLTVVKRSSTYQVAGLASVQANSNLVTGDGTCRWSDQLAVGDAIVIRGMTHTVTSIPDHNTMTVVPEYRGTNNDTRIKILLVQEQRIKQADFNVDVMDSTGPSGYLIDPAKMQMIMIQYTWYGAGFIEFGVRGPNGKFILAHRIKNNNVNDEAYMRSGNLPCRYEASSNGALTKLFGNINSSQTTIQIQDGTFFPANVSVQYPAYISVDNEIVGYTSITKEAYGQGNLVANLTLLTRGTGIGTQLTQWVEGSSKTFTQGANVAHTTGSGVYVIGCTSAPTLTHWGSAVVMDGGYDVDKGYSFSFIRNNVTLPSAEGQKTTLFLMRLAPSVSNTIIGAIGTRDLINRAALDLNNLVVNITGGRYLIEGILNPTNIDIHTTTFVNLNTAQFGNQPSFTQFSTNVQFTGTTLGGLLPSALTASGTGTARGGLRTNAVSYSGTFTSAGVTYWANNVPISAYTTGGGTGAFVTVRITTTALGNANIMTATTSRSFTVTNPGGNVQVGDQIRIYGNRFSPAMTFGTNDANLTITSIGTDSQFANNTVLTTVTGSGSGGNITLRLAQDTTQSITDYASRSLSYTVNATGDGYASGDTVRILGTTLTGVGATPANDLTLRVQSIAGSVTGGERLFAIPITATNSGLLDLRNIKQLGSSAIPGNGVYPDGPEVLAIQITCLTAQATQQFADAQLSFTESQA